MSRIVDEWRVTASQEPYTVTIKTVRFVVEEFLDKYNRQFLGSKEAEELIQELESLNS